MPKTIKNEYDKYLNYNKLMEAHLKSRQCKRCKKDIILFDLKQEDYIKYLYEELKNMTYKHGSYTTFYIREPKLRKIEKSRYIDRVVHRWVVDNFLLRIYEPMFINTTYACLKNRGTLKAANDLQKAMLHCKRRWNSYYILKMDVSKYFQNIDKRILLNILQRKISDKKLLWLIEQILYSDRKQKGIAIGNYTSQIFANIYLNEVDQYIKTKLKVKYYFRYMDDSVLLLETKEEAKQILNNIIIFLKEKLELELNSKTQIFKSKQGVNFCGYKINEYRKKIRNRGKKNLKRKVKSLKKKIKNGNMTSKQASKYLSGHIGYIKYADTHNLIEKLFYCEDTAKSSQRKRFENN